MKRLFTLILACALCLGGFGRVNVALAEPVTPASTEVSVLSWADVSDFIQEHANHYSPTVELMLRVETFFGIETWTESGGQLGWPDSGGQLGWPDQNLSIGFPTRAESQACAAMIRTLSKR